MLYLPQVINSKCIIWGHKSNDAYYPACARCGYYLDYEIGGFPSLNLYWRLVGLWWNIKHIVTLRFITWRRCDLCGKWPIGKNHDCIPF